LKVCSVREAGEVVLGATETLLNKNWKKEQAFLGQGHSLA